MIRKFPLRERTLEAIVQRLGDDGLEAVAAGVRENFMPKEDVRR